VSVLAVDFGMEVLLGDGVDGIRDDTRIPAGPTGPEGMGWDRAYSAAAVTSRVTLACTPL